MKRIVIAVIVILVLAVMLVSGVLLGVVPVSRQPPPTASPSPSPKPVPSPTTTPTPTKPADVKFEFVVTSVTGSGLSRTIAGQMTNTGTADAHNVWVKAEAFSAGGRVKLNGEDFLREDIGTIKAGATVQREITVSLSVFDGLKVAQNGATFTLTVNSDEASQTLNYEYKP